MKNYIYGIAEYSDGTKKVSRNFVNYSAFSNTVKNAVKH